MKVVWPMRLHGPLKRFAGSVPVHI